MNKWKLISAGKDCTRVYRREIPENPDFYIELIRSGPESNNTKVTLFRRSNTVLPGDRLPSDVPLLVSWTNKVMTLEDAQRWAIRSTEKTLRRLHEAVLALKGE